MLLLKSPESESHLYNQEISEYRFIKDDDYNYVGFNNLYQAMMHSFGNNKKTLSEAIENYLINSCGVSTESINNVKNILTD